MSEAERQIELERQEELLQDLQFLAFPNFEDRKEACMNIAAALGLSNEFKKMIGG
jgi:hypothetical protein